MSRKENKIVLLEATLAELEKEYNQAFDALLANDTEANRSKERMLFQAINTKKKELEKCKGERKPFSDKAEEQKYNEMAD